MRKEYTITIILLITLWFLSAMNIQNDIILPLPQDVFNLFFSKLTDVSFYSSILITLKRIAIGFGISLLFAFSIAILSDYSATFKRYFAPIDHILKTIPNISYIILSLIWLGQENSVLLVIFLVVFPVMYAAITEGLSVKDRTLNDAMRLYGKNYLSNFMLIKLPLSMSTIMLGINVSLSLGFKVGVMAEILNQTKGGLGYQLYLAKVNLDMISLFAWTLWIILVGISINWIIKKLIEGINNKVQL